MATKQRSKVDSTKTQYLLKMKDGTMQKVTVPNDWKVTFGPVAPGSKDGGNSYRGLCLRFYESTDKQRAVFTEVESFRDLSIPIEERVTKTQQEVLRKETRNGAKEFVVEAQVHEWINPDMPSETNTEFLRLPSK